MDDFSKNLELLETLDPYKTPKSKVDKASNFLMTMSVFFSLVLLIIGVFYRLFDPAIDKESMLLLIKILELLVLLPFCSAVLIVIVSAIFYAFRYIYRFVIKKIKRIKKDKQASDIKIDQHLLVQVNHDRNHIKELVKKLSLEQLRRLQMKFDDIIQRKEKRISNIFGNQGAVLTMLLLLITFVGWAGGMDFIIKYFSNLDKSNFWEYLIILGLAGILGLVLGALALKVKIARYFYWQGLIQRALLEQQLRADQEAKEKQEKLFRQLEKVIELVKKKPEEPRLSLLQRLFVFLGIS